MARAARDFFKDFDVLAPKIRKKIRTLADLYHIGASILASFLGPFGAGILMQQSVNARI